MIFERNMLDCAGTLPPEWAGLGSDLAEDFVDITLSYNSLTGGSEVQCTKPKFLRCGIES